MSLKISNASGTFDLQKDFNTEIEDSSPIYNERGSQSIASTLSEPTLIPLLPKMIVSRLPMAYITASGR